MCARGHDSRSGRTPAGKRPLQPKVILSLKNYGGHDGLVQGQLEEIMMVVYTNIAMQKNFQYVRLQAITSKERAVHEHIMT